MLSLSDVKVPIDCASSLFLASHSLKIAITHSLFIVPDNVVQEKYEREKKRRERDERKK